jgi:hypothetical protein
MEIMKEAWEIKILFGLAVMLFVSACAGIGPPTVSRDRFDYTTAITQSWKSQMLLNLVKLRYGDTPVFVDVASVINSYELSGSASLGANWKFNPAYESGGNIGVGGFYADRPTITYSPSTGEKFSKSMLTPIPPSAIFFFIQSGYSVNPVFRVLVQSINGIRNSYGGSGRIRPADPEFYLLIEKLTRIQDSGAYEIRIQKSTEFRTPELTKFGSRRAPSGKPSRPFSATRLTRRRKPILRNSEGCSVSIPRQGNSGWFMVRSPQMTKK